MYDPINEFIQDSLGEVKISVERKSLLNESAARIKKYISEPVTFLFVCTHNSRRSQFSQVWAHVFNQSILGSSNVIIQSAGTEVTACNPRTVAALEEIGFEVGTNSSGENPIYHVKFDDELPAIKLWSKTVLDESISKPIVAFMTCSHADENCPFIPGALERVPLTYVDPKRADDTEEEMEVYLETAGIIAAELHYFFSQLK